MSIFGRIARGIGGAVSGFVQGGPVGAIGGAFKGVTSRPTAPMIAPTFRTPTFAQPISLGAGTPFGPGGPQGPNLPANFPGTVPEPGFRGGLQRFLPGGQTGFTGAPPGFHVNKAYLRHVRAAQMGRDVQNPFNEQRAVNVIVRNRKMNPLNPRALQRANARQVAAVRMMRRTLRGSGYTIARPRARFGAKKARR